MAAAVVVMNDGVIEQIGTPTEIYREPASLFVADFIGSMNKLRVTVADQTHVKIGKATFACRSHGLPVNSEAILALRPEDVMPLESAGAAKAVNAYPVKVRDMEFLGSHWRAWLTPRLSAGPRLIASSRSTPCAVSTFPKALTSPSSCRRTACMFSPRRAAVAESVLAPPPRPALTIDRDRILQLVFMAVIALYLILTLAWPLYTMLSKSMTTYRFNATLNCRWMRAGLAAAGRFRSLRRKSIRQTAQTHPATTAPRSRRLCPGLQLPRTEVYRFAMRRRVAFHLAGSLRIADTTGMNIRPMSSARS